MLRACRLLALFCLLAWRDVDVTSPPAPMTSPRVTKALYGRMPDGMPVDGYTIRNTRGTTAHVITYGAIITSLRVADRAGRFDDVVLGFDSLAGYLGDSPYFGAIVGRYVNRIAKGRFTLDGVTYQLPINNPPNSLHGGTRGFDKVVWSATSFENDSAAGVVLTHLSPDGDQGYPGQLDVHVTYTLNDRSELAVDYQATTDKPTPINLSQHSYFNLAGDGRRDVLGHVLQLNASRFLPVDSTLIPTGELLPVAGTPFDFRKPTVIGAGIDQPHDQLRIAGGYDHTYVLDRRGTAPYHGAPSSSRRRAGRSTFTPINRASSSTPATSSTDRSPANRGTSTRAASASVSRRIISRIRPTIPRFRLPSCDRESSSRREPCSYSASRSERRAKHPSSRAVHQPSRSREEGNFAPRRPQRSAEEALTGRGPHLTGRDSLGTASGRPRRRKHTQVVTRDPGSLRVILRVSGFLCVPPRPLRFKPFPNPDATQNPRGATGWSRVSRQIADEPRAFHRLGVWSVNEAS
jgi:aldose 1-epimerase